MFGLYFIGENIVFVVPDKPYIFMNQIQNVNDWYVVLPEHNYVRYDDFINNIKKIDDYDDNHIIICLSKEDIKNLVAKFKTEIWQMINNIF